MLEASYWVEKLGLLPHPEGGFYKENYRSGLTINVENGRERFPNGRSFSTGIYYLLEKGDFSAFHRIKSDEMWHFYAGDPLEIYFFDAGGLLQRIKLGKNPEAGEYFQAVVPANSWFASRPASGSSYSLVGCTVAPGFDFQDFEMAEKEHLLKEFPGNSEIILQLTR